MNNSILIFRDFSHLDKNINQTTDTSGFKLPVQADMLDIYMYYSWFKSFTNHPGLSPGLLVGGWMGWSTWLQIINSFQIYNLAAVISYILGQK